MVRSGAASSPRERPGDVSSHAPARALSSPASWVTEDPVFSVVARSDLVSLEIGLSAAVDVRLWMQSL